MKHISALKVLVITTSLFQLECGYWNAETEENMRHKLKNQD